MIIAGEVSSPMRLPDIALWQAFTDGHRFATKNGETVSTRIADAGALVLPTGRIVVSDPILDPWNKPFSVVVPPGAYPVLLSLIRDEVALAMVRLGEASPVEWKRTKPDSFNVDSATGCFMDHKVSRFLRRRAECDNFEKYMHGFQSALHEQEGRWANCCLDRESGANVVLFRTCGGDGIFPCFFGFGSNGSAVCLIVDMFLCYEHVIGSASGTPPAAT